MSIHFAIVTTLALLATIHSAPGPSPKVRDLLRADYDTMLYGKEKNSTVGFSVLVADVNGDGLGDLIIGAPYSDGHVKKAVDDAGATFVFFGRKSIDKTVDLAAAADLVIYGATKNENSGFALASGDINGDGLKDIVIGAPLADSALAGKKNDSGITYVVFGKRQFPARVIGLEAGMAEVELQSTAAGEYAGSALATGDFNGDAVDDLLIGAPFTDRSGDDAGAVYVVCGSLSLSGKFDLQQKACATVAGQNTGDRLGMAVKAGDLNADGVDDLVLGALETDSEGDEGRNVGRVHVIFGRKDLPSRLELGRDSGFVLSGSYRDDYVGSAMVVGDVNGDQTADLLVGVPYADRNPPNGPAAEGGAKEEGSEGDAGRALVFLGGKSFLGEHSLRDGGDTLIRGAKGGANHGDHSGGTVAIADVNGDGYGDPIIGAPLADAPKGTREESDLDDVGAVFVTYGGRALPAAIDLSDQFQEAIYGASSNDFFAGLALTKQRAKDSFFGGLANPDSYRKAWMSKQYDRFFSTAVAAGDLNGDGVDDLCIGAPTADGPTAVEKIDDAGVVYVIWGRK